MSNVLGMLSSPASLLAGQTTIDGFSYVFVYDTTNAQLKFFDGVTVGGLSIPIGALPPSTAYANYVFAGPTSGAAAAPTFRPLIAADINGVGYANGIAPLDGSAKVATGYLYTNVAGGVPLLDGGGKVSTAQLPAAVQGALNYQGTWNASTNSPALTSGTGTKGFYYTVATSGATTLDGISQWNAGDHAAYNGTAWEKLDGLASEVISFNGRTGAVVPGSSDYTAAQVGAVATTAVGAASGVAPLGAAAQLPVANAPALRGFIAGLAYSNDATTPNTKVDIGPGMATDSTNTVSINSTSALVINFATTGANALDTGTIAASTWYHLHLISGTSGVAGLASISPGAPTLPSGYTYFRRIGSVKTDTSSHILAFKLDEETVWWAAPPTDVAAVALSTTAQLFTLSVPTGVIVRAIVRAMLSGTGASYILTSPDEPDLAPAATSTANPGYDLTLINAANAPWIYTNTSAQVRARSSATPALNIHTRGWVDTRGRFA